MIAFVDTSAFPAMLNRGDENHPKARPIWQALVEENAGLFCTSYVLLETMSPVQHRLGMEAVRVFSEDVVPLLTVEWISMEIHQARMAALLTAGRRNLSLTDCVSFEVMRRRGIRKVFAFDRHFPEQGFELCA